MIGGAVTTTMVVALQAVPMVPAAGVLLVLVGLVGMAYGLYALIRGGRGERGGGLGPIPERGIHVVAGVRMLAGGLAALALGVLALWSYFSG